MIGEIYDINGKFRFGSFVGCSGCSKVDALNSEIAFLKRWSRIKSN